MHICCDADHKAMFEPYAQNILSELNVKTLQYSKDPTELEDKFLQLNFKMAGAALKQNVNKVKELLAAMSKEDMDKAVVAFEQGEQVQVTGWDEPLASDLFLLNTKTKEGLVSAELGDKSAVVALDTRLTEELICEGMLRDVIRQCQMLRKEAGYEVEQKVQLAIATKDATLLHTLQENLAYLQSELLAPQVLLNEDLTADLSKEIEIADKNVTISVAKA